MRSRPFDVFQQIQYGRRPSARQHQMQAVVVEGTTEAGLELELVLVQVPIQARLCYLGIMGSGGLKAGSYDSIFGSDFCSNLKSY